jgi:hypothetical protein
MGSLRDRRQCNNGFNSSVIAMSIMNSRDREQQFLDGCVDVALGRRQKAVTRAEASVFRFAAMSLQSSHPVCAESLWKASDAYFRANPGAPYTMSELVAQGHVLALTRLRDMLSTQLEHQVLH